MEKTTELRIGEFHPMASKAMQFIRAHMPPVMIETMSSLALSGNRTAEICWETHRRIDAGEPVSDRYVLGLAWYIKTLLSGEKQINVLVQAMQKEIRKSGGNLRLEEALREIGVSV